MGFSWTLRSGFAAALGLSLGHRLTLTAPHSLRSRAIAPLRKGSSPPPQLARSPSEASSPVWGCGRKTRRSCYSEGRSWAEGSPRRGRAGTGPGPRAGEGRAGGRRDVPGATWPEAVSSLWGGVGGRQGLKGPGI